MNSEQAEDLEMLRDIFDGIGFSQSLTEGGYDTFHDEEINEAYRQVEQAVKVIEGKYKELLQKI